MLTGTGDDRGAPGAPFLTGREEELRTLLASAASAEKGESRTVFLGGPTGIGKSVLTTALGRKLPTFRTLGISGVAPERQIAFAAVNRLIQSAQDGSRATSRRTPPVPSDSSAMAAGGDLISAVDDYQGDATLFLLIEDAHLLDTASLQTFGFMLLRTTHDHLLTVVNTEHLHETRQAMGLSGSLERVAQLELDGLDVAATRSLLDHHEVTGLAESQVHQITRWSHGNPLYITALARTADAEHRLPARLVAADIAPSLAETVREWCATFTPGARHVLEALAVLNAPATERTLGLMAPDAELEPEVNSLVAGGAARWAPASANHLPLELTHAAQRQALYSAIPAIRRRELHGKAADLLAPPENWLHRIAALDSYDAALAAQLRQIARLEAQQGDPSLAAEYELGIAAVAPDPDERGEATLRAVRLMVTSGQYDAALGYAPFVDAQAASPSKSEVLGLLDYARGHDTGAAEHLRAAREGFAAHHDEDAARVSAQLASLQRSLGLGKQSLRSARYALARTSNPQVIGHAQANIAYGVALSDGPAAGLAQLRHLRENPTGTPAADMEQLVCRGVLRGLSGDLSGAVDDLRYATRRQAQGLISRNSTEAIDNTALCLLMLGEADEARRTLSLAFDHAQVSGRDVDFAVIHSMSSTMYACQGRWEAAEADLEQARAIAQEPDFGGPDFHVRQAAAVIAFTRREWHGVLAELGPALEDSGNNERARLFGLWFLPLLGVAGAKAHDITAAAQAHEALTSLEPSGALPTIAGHWVRGCILLAEGDANGAARVLRDGLAVPAGGGEPVMHRSMVRCELARALVATDEREEAVAQAAAAERAFTRLGAQPFAAWCRDVLGGMRTSERTTEAERFWGELTDRERDTARLVGRGWTTKEIAAELYVSTSTVEFHLSNIYTKGGFRNRRRLRDMVQALER
ncbi:AAA family ATPase [Streptomyces sp. NPDC088729]|uniref:helix-turn-helix transcriptional regulator n=1 Tax=Streptomyces sp. NPDC088729 TaxID=3365876 RepID=UPI0037F41F44